MSINQLCKCELRLRCALFVRTGLLVHEVKLFLLLLFSHFREVCVEEYACWRIFSPFWHRDSLKMFAVKFKQNNNTTPFHTFQCPAMPISGCSVSFQRNIECTHVKLCSLVYIVHNSTLYIFLLFPILYLFILRI